MSERKMVGIVVRKDGTVPFDDDVHPDVHAHILAHLATQGHTLEPIPGTRHVRIVGWTPPVRKVGWTAAGNGPA